jgi:hypothetical protein
LLGALFAFACSKSTSSSTTRDAAGLTSLDGAEGAESGVSPPIDGSSRRDAASLPGLDASSDAFASGAPDAFSTERGLAPIDAGGGVAPMDNPVAGSESDTNVLGSDTNENGIRDDLERFIGGLEVDASKVARLDAFAREQTKMLLLGASAMPTQLAATAQQARVVKTIDCLALAYPKEQRRQFVRTIQAALVNNGLRWRAYLEADRLLSGTILPAPAKTCDLSLIGGAP